MGVLQPARPPRIASAAAACRSRLVIRLLAEIEAAMGLLLLEALGALALFVFIIWWTMFSGRKGGERRPDSEPDDHQR